MEEKIMVGMTKEDAALYVLMCQHWDSLAFLVASKSLDIKKGSLLLDFDAAGRLQRVTKTVSTSRMDLPIEALAS